MQDNPLGTMEKQQAHEQAKLHRAFSVFLYNDDKLLLQKRARTKYHCGGLWTNTCCSHPAPGEDLKDAALRRLKEELGITGINLTEAGSFVYRFPFSNGLTEFEYDHVFIGEFNGTAVPNPDEIEETRWVSIDRILQDCVNNASAYTPWFLTAIGIANRQR